MAQATRANSITTLLADMLSSNSSPGQPCTTGYISRNALSTFTDHGATWKKAGTLYGIPYDAAKLSGDFIPDEPQVQINS